MIFGPPPPLESHLCLMGAGPTGGGGDSTPGGANDVILMEDAGGILLEDGTSFIQLDG